MERHYEPVVAFLLWTYTEMFENLFLFREKMI